MLSVALQLELGRSAGSRPPTPGTAARYGLADSRDGRSAAATGSDGSSSSVTLVTRSSHWPRVHSFASFRPLISLSASGGLFLRCGSMIRFYR